MSPWLGVLAALAGPVAVAAVYARQLKQKAPAGVSHSLSSVQRRSSKYVEARPLRWYHIVVLAALLALPFVQWFAFLEFQTRLSFLLPLAITAGLMFVVSGFFPRFVLPVQSKPLNRRDTLLPVAVLAVALAGTLVLSPTGLVILLRGAFSDILVILLVTYLARALQRTRTESR